MTPQETYNTLIIMYKYLSKGQVQRKLGDLINKIGEQ